VRSIIGRRLFLGLVAGVIVAAVVGGLVSAGGNEGLGAARVPFGRGSVALLVVTGGLLGLCYAWLFLPVAEHSIADIGQGMMVGVGLWVVLVLNIYPALSGQRPMWQVDAVAASLPQLIACLAMGGLAGLVYSLAFRRLDDLLQLSPSRQVRVAPAIKTRVVIVGGGYAGVAAAETLEKEFARDPEVEIWLVSSTNYLLHTPLLSEVAASAVDARNISPPLRSAFRRVQVVQGTVEQVDMHQRILYLQASPRSPQRTLRFDHLIVAVGAIPNFFGNKSIKENCFQFKTLNDAVRLRGHIIGMFERADQEENREKRSALLTILVAGGGFAGVELIGSLNDFARGISLYYPNIDPDEICPILVHSGTTILPELSAELGQYAQQKLAERGVRFKLQTRVSGAEPGKVLLGDEAIVTETFVWTAGSRPSPLVEMLGIPLSAHGQIEVDRHLAVAGIPGLWAAGDCAQIPDPHSRTGFSPPTAQHALREGKLIGQNVAASIRHQPLREWNFKTLGSLSALGHQLAVAEIFGYRFSGFLAWLMWRSIYLSKLPTLEKRLRVGLDWLMDIFFPPDIVQVIDFSREGGQ
jgi:NADH:ubiquinone reductase (H+-translocating)